MKEDYILYLCEQWAATTARESGVGSYGGELMIMRGFLFLKWESLKTFHIWLIVLLESSNMRINGNFADGTNCIFVSRNIKLIKIKNHNCNNLRKGCLEDHYKLYTII